MTDSYHIKPIAFIRSPFKQKFGLPRQPGLIRSVDATIDFQSPYDDPDAFEGITQFSHLWLTFLFHQNPFDQWKPKVRPPRLGGNKKLGVFATRSSFRPNNIGLSVVELKDVLIQNQKTKLIISCPDLVDGTPIVDIKPYISYSDAIESARSGFASLPPSTRLTVEFSEQALEALERIYDDKALDTQRLIEETLSLDPRPAYKTSATSSSENKKVHAICLNNTDINWLVSDNVAHVLDVTLLD